MTVSFEEKLLGLSSADALKNAKQLLKNQLLSCAYRTADGQISAAFAGPTPVRTLISTGDSPRYVCSCHHDDKQLCEHAVAAIMYYGRFTQPITPIDDGNTKYAGLKYEPLTQLAQRARPQHQAQLHLSIHSEFPHVPSKWENSVLCVTLKAPNREYLGNVNNLRQLYFDKTLSINLQLGDFTLQEQQIIRFLAINGEPDSSKILLNSEQTAEFFHCLVGFDRFTKDGRKLIVHRECCEPVILQKGPESHPTLCPGIKVGSALLALPCARVITGRAGCWIGKQGEYYFIPALQEVGWLRNFFRTGEQTLAQKVADTFLLDGQFPLPVLSVASFEMSLKQHQLLLSAQVDKETLDLHLQYLYEQQIFESNSGRLGRNEKNFFRRDEEAERAFERELTLFGFSADNAHFYLSNAQAVGIFLDEVLPWWLSKYPNLLLDRSLAKLCRGGIGLAEPNLTCNLKLRATDHYVLGYSLQADRHDLKWRDLLAAAHARSDYLCQNNSWIKLPENFRRFLLGAETVMRKLDERNQCFELPFYSTEYWSHIAGMIPGAVPSEFNTADVFAMPENPNDALSGKFQGELRGYQQEGVTWLQQMTDRNFNVILADEMGLGKTVQLLAMLASRKRSKMPPALIICPASLVTNWEREAHKFVPDFKVAALAGNGRESVWDNANQYDLIVVSYATSCRDAASLQSHEFSYLVLDEAQHIKNPGTVNAQNCKSIRAAHKIVLTGTPLENSCDDLWSIFDFLHHGMLGSFAAFRKYYSDLGADALLQGDLAARVSPFIKRRTKALVAKELPTKEEHTIFCEMDAKQRALYEETRQLGRRQLQELGDSSKLNTEIFTTLLRLRQICCHPSLLPNGDDRIPSAKFDLLKELVHEHIDSNHKMLIFSQFTSVLSVIQNWLDAEKIKYEYLDGGTRNRQQRVDKFNNSANIPIFLLSIKAGGTGLNLTSADTVIIYDPWWNPAVELQATDRTHRIGQTKAVSSLKLLVKDSIEEKILDLQNRKQEIFDSVIDNPNAYSDKLSIDELRFLLN